MVMYTQVESGLFPYYKDYFPARRLPGNVLIPDLGELTEAIHLHEYDIIKGAIARTQRGRSRVALLYNAKGDIERKGQDIGLSGTVIYQTDGNVISEKSLVKSGIFTTDDVLVQAANMALRNTSIRSYGSTHLSSRGDASFDAVSVQSEAVTYIGAQQQITIHSSLEAAGSAGVSFRGEKGITGQRLDVSSKDGIANVTTGGDLSLRHLNTGSLTTIEADSARVGVLSSDGATTFKVDKAFTLDEAQGKGSVHAQAQQATTGPISMGGEFSLKADRFTATGSIETGDDTLIDTKCTLMKEGVSFHACKKIIFRAMEELEAGSTNRVEGDEGTLLYAPKTEGFLGTIASNTEAQIWLKSMELENIAVQINAPKAEVHLDSDVRVDRNVNLSQNLHLFANSFENRATIFAPSGFVIHMVGDINNAGVIASGTDLILLTTKGMVVNSRQATASEKLGVQGKSIYNTSVLDGGEVHLVATDGSIVSEKGRLYGKRSLKAIATGSIISKQDDISSSDGDIEFQAGNQCHFYASHVDACGNITAFGVKGVMVHDVHEQQRTESHTAQKANGLFSLSRKRDSISFSSTSKGAFFASKNGEVTLRSSEGDVTVTNIQVKASHTTLEALRGTVSILQGKNEFMLQEHERSENISFIKDTLRSRHKITHSASSFSGGVTVKARETIVETVKGQALDFIKDMETNGGKVSYISLENLLSTTEESHTAPTAALSAVVALAARYVPVELEVLLWAQQVPLHLQ